MKGISNYFKKLKTIFFSGLSSHEIAKSLTFGFLLGIIPFIGVSTLLCMFASYRWKLNLAILLTINCLVYPLQLLLIVPFLKATSYMFNLSDSMPSYTTIFEKLHTNFLSVIIDLGYLNILAIFVWFILSAFLGWFIYEFTLVIVKYIVNKIEVLKLINNTTVTTIEG